ncbi:class I SAM-dependent methyltransferase [Oceanobacillus arenosus]|uniref:Class I SAM-dependent methyltransferase n=1 Tax=Oceanobacillus arenosus TaxID=1229153 RepID=A0A3D8PQF2_9BACI|nr:class I SAM-dependent methyltransferase [Oceanobacillus arenosus]RDW18350.1 class I SAM-dependent methyltransferase [Oceanobacillus arenosus]
MVHTYLDFLASFGVGGAHPGALQLTKHIFSTINLDATKHVLDAGCGTGQSTAYIVEKYGCLITALDNNEMMLNKAIKRFSSNNLPVHTVNGDIEHLLLDNASFDLILSESVLAFTTIPVALNELRRILKPGGMLIAVEIVLEQPLIESEKKSIIDFYGFSQLLTESDWHNLLKQAGFKQVLIETFNQKIEEDNVEDAPDFSPSDTIDEQLYEILAYHQHLSRTYNDILGFRIFRCT